MLSFTSDGQCLPHLSRHMARLYRILLVLFVLSGASGLIYEVVWLRMLIRSFGVTVYAVSTILAVFMGGLAAGAAWAGRRASRFHSPVRAYGWIEILIAVSAIASTGAMQVLPGVVAFMGGHDVDGSVVAMARIVLASACLLPTTFLMGATLPVLSALVGDPTKARRRVGLLYGANTCGAVFGVVASGFLLLGTVGEWRTVLGGALLNAIVGIRALTVVIPREAQPSYAASVPSSTGPGPVLPGLLAWIAALTGLSALVYQVVWARILISVIGNSVYGFSSMLAAYLAGIAGGAMLVATTSQRRRSALWLAFCQVIMALGAVWSLQVATWIGESEPDPRYLYSRIWEFGDFAVLPLYALCVVLPVTAASGAVFPLVTDLASRAEGVVSRAVGRVYAANTWGAIAGSILAGFVLVPAVGAISTLLIAAFICLGTGALVLRTEPQTPRWHFGVLGIMIGLVGLSAVTLQDPVLRVMQARLPDNAEVLFHAEDVAAHVSVVGRPHNVELYVNGLHVSGTGEGIGMLFVSLPISFHPAPRSALIVGLGAAEATVAALDQGLDVTVAELVPTMVETFPLTQPDRRPLGDDGARVVLADGRNHILGTRDRYDYILVDISPPIFSSGAVNLYTMDFLSLAKRRLTEDGILAIWVPARCFESDFWNIAYGFGKVFHHALVWAAPGGNGALLLGTDSDRSRFDVGEEVLRARLRARGVEDATGAFWTRNRLIHDDDLRAYASPFGPVTDDRPTTEFPLFRFARGDRFWQSNGFLADAFTFATLRRTSGASSVGASEVVR